MIFGKIQAPDLLFWFMVVSDGLGLKFVFGRELGTISTGFLKSEAELKDSGLLVVGFGRAVKIILA
ncbi:MAG: hypothetical protein ACFFDN_18100 [Candidatus Hodarchaeota archaeon]